MRTRLHRRPTYDQRLALVNRHMTEAARWDYRWRDHYVLRTRTRAQQFYVAKAACDATMQALVVVLRPVLERFARAAATLERDFALLSEKIAR